MILIVRTCDLRFVGSPLNFGQPLCPLATTNLPRPTSHHSPFPSPSLLSTSPHSLAALSIAFAILTSNAVTTPPASSVVSLMTTLAPLLLHSGWCDRRAARRPTRVTNPNAAEKVEKERWRVRDVGGLELSGRESGCGEIGVEGEAEQNEGRV